MLLLLLKIATRLQTDSKNLPLHDIFSLKIAANQLLGGRGMWCSMISGFGSNSCNIAPGKSRWMCVFCALSLCVCVREQRAKAFSWCETSLHMHACTNTHNLRFLESLRKLCTCRHTGTHTHTHPSQLLVLLLQLRLQLSQPLFHVAMALLGLQEATPT